MSCNGCRVLRKGCNDNCVLRPCLQWIESAEAQGNATVFVAKFFGRAGLMGFIGAVAEDQRAALFQSLLYEACGRTVNPVHGALGLLWSGKWSVCEAAVETVLKGGSLKAPAAGGGGGGLGLGLGLGLGGSGSLAPAAAAGAGAGGTFPLPRQLPPQATPLERGRNNPGLGVMQAAMASRPSSCRARSSFTGHHQHSAQSQSHSQSQEEVRQQGRLAVGLAAAAVRAAAHEVDNASEISSAGTGRLVEERTGVGEEMKLREMLLRGHEWSSGMPRAVSLAGDGDGDGGAKENGDAGRRTWQQSVTPAPAVVSSSLPYTLWCGAQGEQSGSRVVDTRVKRELEDDDVRMGNQLMSPLARRVQPRLELYSNSASGQPDLQWQQRPAAGARDRCEVDAREMDAKPLPAAASASACAVELNLALNTYSLGKSKELQQQQRKLCPGQAAGGAGNGNGRVSSPSCGSVNSEGSVTSLDSSKSAVSVSPWTLQLASALQSNRQLLPLLR